MGMVATCNQCGQKFKMDYDPVVKTWVISDEMTEHERRHLGD